MCWQLSRWYFCQSNAGVPGATDYRGVALAGVSVGVAVGAAIPVEALCGIPGIGTVGVAILARDLPVVTMGSWAVISCTVLANSGSDLRDDRSRR